AMSGRTDPLAPPAYRRLGWPRSRHRSRCVAPVARRPDARRHGPTAQGVPTLAFAEKAVGSFLSTPAASDLAKKSQNPVADLISVPFQNSFLFNTGPEKRTVWDLNIEPVIPIHLTGDWNLITRTIVPIINLGRRADVHVPDREQPT